MQKLSSKNVEIYFKNENFKTLEKKSEKYDPIIFYETIKLMSLLCLKQASLTNQKLNFTIVNTAFKSTAY